ncbi:18571_t:CDS:2 [Rhizophagus irregularis]|nr:18571_t:CDS:2 [Rhizophagus irregularis]
MSKEKTRGLNSFPVEIIHNIFHYLEKDISTLYSCVRVNRNLCKQVIPYLWNNPMPNTYSPVNIEIFIRFFDEKVKNLLKNQYELDIEDSYQPLFNYTCYIKILDPRGVRRAAFYCHGIREITKLSIMNSSVKQFDNIQEFLDLLPTVCKNIKKVRFYDLFFIDPTMELKLCNVIKSQKNLTSINLTYNFVNILRLISVIKHQANSLKKLVLRYIHHNDMFLLNTFDQLINLEYLEINECYPINIILEPLIRANLKLVTLKINDIEIRYDLVESIIKSSGSTLKHLELNIYIDIIENSLPLSKLCPNLSHLDLKRRFDHFSTMFNEITFYIDSESDEYYLDPLEDFVREKKDSGLSLNYTFDGYYNFVATDRILY